MSRVQVDDTSPKARSISGLRYWKVRRVTLSTDRGVVVLSAVQWRFGFLWIRIPRIYGFVDLQR